MQYTPDFLLDRFAGVLSAQLLSSQTVGTFQINTSAALGAQLATMASGYQATVTIENEQILCSAFSVSGNTVTCTIATSGRGYNSTTAATHASDTAVEIHLIKGVMDNISNHLKRFDDLGLIISLGTGVTTISSAPVHIISGDYTTYFTVGRVFLFAVSGTWYRAIVRSSSYGGGTTTVNLTGDGLPASGTVTNCGFEMSDSTRAPVDYALVKAATNVPAQSPPSGYKWLYVKGGGWFTKNSSGEVQCIGLVTASVSSSGGVLTCDCSTANFFECTLTENITQLTWSNGVDGEHYHVRFRQHASSAKTVALNTAGGTRFSNDITSYAVTATVAAVDYLEFRYDGTDVKWDLFKLTQGFLASPVATSSTPPGIIMPYGGITAPTGFLLCDGAAVSRTTYAALFTILAPTLGTVTISIAAPGVVTYNGHGLATGDGVYLTTTGALPTGLAINTKYWVIKNDADTFWLATSLANALAGTKITTTGSQSGTHTGTICPYGVGNGSTTFTLPNLLGSVIVGKDQSQTEFAGLGQTGGEKTHTLTAAEIASHTHGVKLKNGGLGGSSGYAKQSDNEVGYPATETSDANSGGDGAHNNLQPYIGINYIIKT